MNRKQQISALFYESRLSEKMTLLLTCSDMGTIPPS